MSDLISRAAAIDAIRDMCEECDSSYCGECRVSFPGRKDCEKVLEGLPSAQPEIEERTEESAQNVPKEDLISRKAAIDAVEILLEQTEEDADVKTWNNAIRGAINSIKHHVPSAQPEQKKGKWVGYDGDWLKTMCKCSECGAMIDINEKYRNFFCYHCGARMERRTDAV